MIKQIQTSNKSIFKLIKGIAIGLAIPVISISIWYSFAKTTSPFNEYLLITKGITTNGFITNAEEFQDVAEMFDGRKSELVYDYSYDYNFKSPDGNLITANGNEDGRLPENLTNLNSNPYPVKVQYLQDNPQINRVLDFNYNKTIYEWIRYRVLFGFVILLASSFMGLLYIKSGVKSYNMELFDLNK